MLKNILYFNYVAKSLKRNFFMIKINEKDLKGIEERFKKLLKISNEPFLKEERLKFSLKNNS
ncbi:MAG: hypothetical protein RMJ34_04625, partial [candidate division WOR-3 bacterium]|nr:hypothetical protein [candidate division WOR-3 bacterium]MDW8114200.1 hypothetical protein [candidate division WOR-3 bacterium]